MVRTLMTAAVLAATLAAGVVPTTASARDWHDGDRGYGYDHGGDHRDYGYDRGYDRGGYDHERYARRYYGGYGRGDYGGYGGGYAYIPAYRYPAYGGYYDAPTYGYYQQSYRPAYRYDGRCRSDGAAGAVLGAIAGGLIGNGLSGRRDRGFGTVVGVGGGAIAGSAIARSGC